MSESARFHDRVCLVSGGSRGIGRAIAEGLVREGARVAIGARSLEQCRETADAIGALALSLDVSDAASCADAVAAVSRELGRTSVLINAAGVSPVRQKAEHHDLAAWRTILEINLLGSFQLTQAAAGELLLGGGAVVMVASMLGTMASPRLAAYGASKGGLVQLTRTLAREWAAQGVRVNAIGPGYVPTDLNSGLLANDRLLREIVDATPMGRLGELREVVSPALFLASDEASYITGQLLCVDGGTSA